MDRPRVVTQHELDRRLLCTKAIAGLWDALDRITDAHGELTGWEWVHVFQEIQSRLIAMEKHREWRGEPVDPSEAD